MELTPLIPSPQLLPLLPGAVWPSPDGTYSLGSSPHWFLFYLFIQLLLSTRKRARHQLTPEGQGHGLSSHGALASYYYLLKLLRMWRKRTKDCVLKQTKNSKEDRCLDSKLTMPFSFESFHLFTGHEILLCLWCCAPYFILDFIVPELQFHCN